MVRLPFKKYKLLVTFIALLYMISSALEVAKAFLFKNIFNSVYQENFHQFTIFLVKVGFYLVALVVTSYLLWLYTSEFRKRYSRDLKDAVMNKITTMDFNNFTANNSSKYVSIINNDVIVLDSDYYYTIIIVLYGIFTSGKSNFNLKKLKAKSAALSGGIYSITSYLPRLLAAALIIMHRMSLGTILLLMDEATSSPDPLTAQAIERNILNQKEMTAVSITHHLTSQALPMYDQIMVIQDGCFVEQGSFDELMKKQGVF